MNETVCAHGWIDSPGYCRCPINWAADLCDYPLNMSDGAWSFYRGMRMFDIVVFSLLSAIALWRTVVVVRSRLQSADQSQTKAPRSKHFAAVANSQVACLVLLSIGSGCYAVFSVDPFGLEGVLNRKQSDCVEFLALAIGLLGMSSCVYFFIDIQARFHRPTRHVRLGLVVVCAALCTTMLILAAMMPSLDFRSYKLSQYAHAVLVTWEIVLTVGSSIYVVAILRSVSKSNATVHASLDPTSAERSRSLTHLVKMVRGVQLAAVAGIILFAVQWTTPNASFHPATIIGFAFGYQVLVILLIIGVLLLMGRRRSNSGGTGTSAEHQGHARLISNANSALSVVPGTPLGAAAHGRQGSRQLLLATPSHARKPSNSPATGGSAADGHVRANSSSQIARDSSSPTLPQRGSANGASHHNLTTPSLPTLVE